MEFLSNTHFFGFNVNSFSLRRESSALSAVSWETVSFPKMIRSSAIFLLDSWNITDYVPDDIIKNFGCRIGAIVKSSVTL